MTVETIGTDDDWLIRFVERPRARARLFCLHHAGAAASEFRTWQAALPDDIELVAIQLPGREYRLAEPVITDMAEIVGKVTDVIAPLLDKPFLVFGHSMGILVGFNVTRELRTRGLRQPEMLLASGRNAPDCVWKDKGVELLPDDQFVNAVGDYNGIPDVMINDPSMWELWLPRLRADLAVSAKYQHAEQLPLAIPFVVFWSAEDQLVSEQGVKAWRSHTTGKVRFVECPGDHFFLKTSEDLILAEVNAEIDDLLDKIGGPYDPGTLPTKEPIANY